ncbi:MAG: hypothetical protein ISS36_01475 [Candidatus Aenigmarchaeota archaeon]|nr:hypothetical protein [Candidatus Aenigmarchaeota archaeon]
MLNYFEKGTIKWKRLNEFINGFEETVENVEVAKNILDASYPKLRKISFSDIIEIIKNKESFDLYEILEKVNLCRSSLGKRMELLTRTNILIKKRRKRNIYNFNENIKKWRLPNTN